MTSGKKRKMLKRRRARLDVLYADMLYVANDMLSLAATGELPNPKLAMTIAGALLEWVRNSSPQRETGGE